MDGASRLFPTSTEMTLGRLKLTLTTKLAKHWAQVEQYILSKRPNMIDEMFRRITSGEFGDDTDLARELMSLAMDKERQARFASRTEVNEFSASLEGSAYWVWLSARENDPALTFKQVMAAMFEEMEVVSEKDAEQAAHDLAENLMRALNAVSGEDSRGNSTGPNPTEGEGETTAASHGDGSPGD